ncbi:MAG: hypothetical protein RQ715_07175 [Methylococcales bacterium]|nr:hypothetical protein [Methylococcales bacterium]
MNQRVLVGLALVGLLSLSGCASFGRGVAEAFLEKQEAKDTRACEVVGKSFAGVRPHLNTEDGKMKLLMVHGVGSHLPGYSTRFREKLAQELALDARATQFKTVHLTDPLNTDKDLGELQIHRLLDKQQNQELLFYELTWSAITEPDKKVLSYDNSGAYSFRRAEVNDLMKKFSNDTGPDPIIYLGERREDILIAFVQSFCWMINGTWAQLPNEAKQACTFDDLEAVNNLRNDQYAFVSHSLGSRITIDGLQRFATFFLDSTLRPELSRPQAMLDILRQKNITIYMMSNQLPMLQLGRKLPDVHDQRAAYCYPEGELYGQHMVKKTQLIAFSDPNDLLSYAVPQSFVDRYLDSRLCFDVTNININVAKIFDAFGLGTMANPLDAHVNYDSDDRVVAMIAKGIGKRQSAEIVKQRCDWVRTID